MATRIGMQVNSGQLNLAPGDKAEVSIVLTNSSEVVDAYTITVLGLDPRWYDLSTEEVRLFPRQIATVTLSIHPPAGGMSTLAGLHPYTIMAISRDNPTEQAIEQGTISIASSGGLSLALGPKRVSGRRGLYGAVVTNHSNSPRQFVLTATDPEEALHYSLGTPQERVPLEGEQTTVPPSPRLPGTTYGVEGPPVDTPPYGNTLVQAPRVLEHEMELAPGASVTVPVLVKPINRVWTGRERIFPFQVGIHPPGVEWEATEAQVAQADLAYQPIFGFLAGLPLGLRRLLAIAIPLLILGLLLFLLLRPQPDGGGNAASQTQTAIAAGLAQTQTAQALALSQTQTAVMQSVGGNQAAANATMTALAQSAASAGQTQTALAQLTVSAQQTAAADAILFASGAVNIQRFFLNVGKDQPDGTRTESVIDYDVVGAQDVSVTGKAKPGTLTGLDNANMVDYTLVATGTNGQPVTSTLSLLVFMPPAISRFDASPNAVTAGDSTNLTWTIKGAREVTIDDIPVTSNPDGTGSITVTPTGTRRFIMCARNDAGMNCKALLVTVLAPGQPTPTPAPPTPTDTAISIPIVTNTPPRVPTTAVPVVSATPCADNYIVEREESATPIPTGTLVPGSQCADCTVNVALPFTFQLYDRLFDAVNMGANGTLSFATNSGPATNTFFDNETLNYSILPHWDNLTTAGTGRGIFTRTDGDAPNRVFTIGYRARYASDGANVNFDVRLFESAPDQRIEVIYGTVAQTGRSASVGVQRDTEQRRTPYEFNEDGTLLPGYKLIFRIPCGAGVVCASGAKIYLDPEAVLPNEVLVESGSVIVWVNTERRPVEVEGAPAGGTSGERWDSGDIPPTGRYERVFNTPGTYEYVSDSAPGIRGRIRVVESCVPRPTSTPVPSRTVTTVRVATVATSAPTITGAIPPTSTPTGTNTPTNTPTGTFFPPTATTTRLPPTVPPPGFCPQIQTFTESIDDKDPTQTGRIGLNGSPSTCGVPSSCAPADAAPHYYDSYTFTNTSGSLQCVTVELSAPTCDGRSAVMSVVYLGSFNPASVCQNYIASSGPASTNASYSFHVPNNTTIVIVVNAVEAGGSCGSYILRVGICVQPTLVVPPTFTNTPVPTITRTFTPVPTATRTNTLIPTSTNTSTNTSTATNTATATDTATSTNTSTPTSTSTATSTVTNTATPTITPTATCIPATNYSYEVGTGTYISGTNLVLSDCDDCTVPITLPFPVRIYDQVFSNAIVGDNGTLGFGSNPNSPVNTCLPAAGFQYAVFPAWNDYVLFGPSGAEGVYTSLLGSAPNRRLIIDWRVNICSLVEGAEGCLNNPVNFEVVLYETPPRTAQLDVIYGFMSRGGDDATIGIQRDANGFTQVACPVSNLLQGTRVSFFIPPCVVTTTPTPTVPQFTRTATVTPTPAGVCIQYTSNVTNTTFTAGGTVILSGCNDCTTTVPLIFPVQFYGQTYNSVIVSDNGTVQFTGNNPSGANTCLGAAGFTNTIFAFWDDLNITPAGRGVFVRNGQGVIEILWNAIDVTGANVAFEVAFIFNQPGNVYLIYNQLPTNGLLGTIGIQRDVNCFEQFSCNTSAITPGTLLTYFPQAGTATPSPTATINPQCPPDGYCISTSVNGGPSASNPARVLFDEGTVTLTAPFPIRFYTTTTTTLTAGDNGTLALGVSNPNPQANTCLPNPSLNNPLLPYWDSISMLSAGQGIYTDTFGSAPFRTYRVLWTGTIVSTGQPVTFAINFFEDSASTRHFEFQYGNGATGTGATIGVQQGTGTRFTQWACNTPGGNTCSGCYIRFNYQGPLEEVPLLPTTTRTAVSEATPVPAGTGTPAQPPPTEPPAPTGTPESASPTSTLTPEASPTTTPIEPTPTPIPGFSAASSCQVWTSSDVGKEFQVNGTLQSSLTVPRDGIISSVSLVGLDLSKPGGRALDGALLAPDGTRIELFQWGCQSKRDGSFHWLDVSLRTSSRSDLANLYCEEGASSGAHEPGGALAQLNGMRARGEWTLRLQTTSPRNAAFSQLEAWGLEVCYARDPSTRTMMIAGATSAENAGLDLLLAVLFAALVTVGAPLAWAKRSSFI